MPWRTPHRACLFARGYFSDLVFSEFKLENRQWSAVVSRCSRRENAMRLGLGLLLAVSLLSSSVTVASEANIASLFCPVSSDLERTNQIFTPAPGAGVCTTTIINSGGKLRIAAKNCGMGQSCGDDQTCCLVGSQVSCCNSGETCTTHGCE